MTEPNTEPVLRKPFEHYVTRRGKQDLQRAVFRHLAVRRSMKRSARAVELVEGERRIEP
jgi:hypothetical protein